MSLEIRIVEPFSRDAKDNGEVYTIRFVKEWTNQIHIYNKDGEGKYMTNEQLFTHIDNWFKENVGNTK
jgi:uncharacterized protein YigE (DUF2233 family)